MSNEMKVIMERWDRFVLLESDTLDKIKKSETDTKNLIQQISKIDDEEQLQNFLNIVSQDEEIMDLISSFKKMKDIAETEKVDEGFVDDFMNKSLKIQTDVYVKAQHFFDTELGKKIAKYGPAVAAIALVAYGVHDSGGFNSDGAMDAIEFMSKAKAKDIKGGDIVGLVLGADPQTGLEEEQV